MRLLAVRAGNAFDSARLMMRAPVYCSVDTRNLVGALKVLQQYSRQEPSESLHRAVAFTIKDAKEHTPFTEISRIDTELSVQTTPVLSTRGKRKGLPLKSGRTNIAVTEGGLATKIVLSRLHRYSYYNLLTDQKYALDKASFSPGEGQAGFWAKVEETAKRMVRSRHSSTHFFQVSWNAVLLALAPYVPSSYRGAVFSWAGGRSVPAELGAVTPAKPNDPRAVCVIENRLGMDDDFPTISAIRNEAAHRILEPVLQSSINRQYERAMAEVAKRNLLARSPSLAVYGVRVS